MNKGIMLVTGSVVVGAIFGPVLFSLLSVLIYIIGGAGALLLVLYAWSQKND